MKQAIFRSWWVKLLAASALAVCVGLGAGTWLLARLEANLSALRFEQTEIDLRQNPAIEGDPIEVIAQLHNYGKVPIRITDLVPS